MKKKLSKMTMEELWELFPIILTENKEEWKIQYIEMEKLLQRELALYRIIRISHIGSTAIKNIWAKPIVDILVEIPVDEDMNDVAAVISKIGFRKMSEDKGRISFNYGYTENGFADKVFHLHLRFKGDNDELYFRDHMNEHLDVAKKYEKKKLKLWHQYEHNRDGYTEAKGDFIKKYTLIARDIYKDKYK